MTDRGFATILATCLVVVAACAGPQPSADLADRDAPVAEASHQVIVGVGADHVAITEPLVEVIPETGDDDAEVTVAFEQADPPVMLGMEGAVAFLRAHAPDGSVVMDRIVDFEGDSVALAPGEYVLVPYYRSCDGNCGLLDPPHEFCSIDAVVEADGVYELVIPIRDREVADCEYRAGRGLD